jgi:PAS domain S-box-containing protein
MSFLERPEAIYEALVLSAREPMTVVNEAGLIVLANDAALKLTGHAMHEYLGLRYAELIHPEDQQQTTEILERALNSLEPWRLRVRLRRQDSHWLLVETIVKYIDLGGARFALMHGRDVSELEHLEMRLHHAQKLNVLGRLAAGLADEFEQVVATIRGHLAGVLEQTAERPALLGLHAMARATEKATTLTRQLRIFIETTPPVFERIDAHTVIEEIRRASLNEVWLHVSLKAPRSTVIVDRSGLTTGLRNLISSIRHEMTEPAAVAVKTSDVAEAATRSGNARAWVDYLLIEVSNTSTGAPQDVDPKFFDESFAAPLPGGVMISLAILDDIVGASGGWIEVGSSDSGGTLVRIFVPLE